jgi:FemAB-related protein (PEP-CTERM system-associated)
MTDVVITDAPAGPAWDAYGATHPAASNYHQWAWRAILERAFGHRTVYLEARRAAAIVGVLPLVEFRSRVFGTFAVSLPFVNYGGVLADDADTAAALGSATVDLAARRRWRHVELRHLGRQFPQWPSRSHKVAMRLALPSDSEALWQELDRKVRNLVRKAEKAGCTVESGGGELVPDFHGVFARNMRDLGTPVYGARLFSEVVRHPETGGRVYVVRWNGKPVAASVTVSYRGVVEVPWASSLREHAAQSPNMLLYWAMLRDAIASGASTFDFGRSTPGEGTFQFKRQWGAEPTPLIWEYLGERGSLPDRSPANPKFRAAIGVWQRLPVRVATWCGPHVVRHIP